MEKNHRRRVNRHKSVIYSVLVLQLAAMMACAEPDYGEG